MDVRQAYFSVELAEEKQTYHCVKFRDKYYRMTRLAFGVQSGPRVLFRTLDGILGYVESDSSIYRDDLFLSEDQVEPTAELLREDEGLYAF